ncbi:hypothetical protein PSN45_004279 [Yamadazyma tenuis]|uniref:Alpha/beta-hydrolase n=1 Tax=Candida tenuis (strain ATCC 10573 / BCRC 21748 / CBS 615 / JCM 9827 / NBRC 10315 / NRRL Y-1498 / VKM Y-70) TaxID=590646 RepID=G3B6D0_CANTC|nr:alpha/beta-hydrolase [Yamadazyma tenuis ATCC 10573]XP_006687470.1 uncharacterized protein CANTEDRAFT_114742 [Yamadazyma tenuis ATCC 10573]EGV63676.1 alpha/beta-hydrolase [Yamadazyma tenuis ATCC 10573]EGV63677.1 hypothetical protein CANTEDRAFT_114742 [Yamadazyma tenuis ATCC 10573]WEJ96736.1 hypothetical protein PSN45_004279 [Yamadazyma tenuis]
MATLGSCCTEKILHEGTPAGSYSTVHGLDTYVTGDVTNKKILVIITDIFGYKLNNVLLLADQLAKLGGYKVLIPDIFDGDIFVAGNDVQAWFPKHSESIVAPIINDFLKKLKEDEKPTFLGGIGYCFGGKYVMQHLSKDGYFDAGATPHPSLVVTADVEAIERPLLISTPYADQMFGNDLRRETEDILSKKEGLKWEITLFSGVTHGYSVRGDISQPQIKYAKEKTVMDQLAFFANCQ